MFARIATILSRALATAAKPPMNCCLSRCRKQRCFMAIRPTTVTRSTAPPKSEISSTPLPPVAPDRRSRGHDVDQGVSCGRKWRLRNADKRTSVGGVSIVVVHNRGTRHSADRFPTTWVSEFETVSLASSLSFISVDEETPALCGTGVSMPLRGGMFRRNTFQDARLGFTIPGEILINPA